MATVPIVLFLLIVPMLGGRILAYGNLYEQEGNISISTPSALESATVARETEKMDNQPQLPSIKLYFICLGIILVVALFVGVLCVLLLRCSLQTRLALIREMERAEESVLQNLNETVEQNVESTLPKIVEEDENDIIVESVGGAAKHIVKAQVEKIKEENVEENKEEMVTTL